MIRVAVDELIKEVRIALDENASQTEYIKTNADNLELDDIIKAKLPEAARDVTETADVELLEPETMKTELTRTDGGGKLSVPEDSAIPVPVPESLSSIPVWTLTICPLMLRLLSIL